MSNMVHEFDKSIIRKISQNQKIPITELILQALSRSGEKVTLLGICPISISVVKSAFKAAKHNNFPLMFVATLNQVDIDGGYTGWTQKEFVEFVKEEARNTGFEGPIIIALDHGGPWLKDKHVLEGLSFEEAMELTKKSIRACLEAGYDLLHIDATVDKEIPEGTSLDIKTIAERTADLIEYAEEVRKELGQPKISYEVGTEEVVGGITTPETLRIFLENLREAFKRKRLENVWPCFVVANVGTYLTPQNRFETEKARQVIAIARRYGSYIKGHFTDYVVNPEDYPRVGMGGANIGPSLAHAEYESLKELAELEQTCATKSGINELSNISTILDETIIKSNRWRKWLKKDELDKNFEELPAERKKWLLQTSSRYILSQENINRARMKLYENLNRCGINAEKRVIESIMKVIERYVKAFNLRGSNALIQSILKERRK